MYLFVHRPCIWRICFGGFDGLAGEWNRSPSAGNIVRAMPSDHAEPGGKFLRIAHPPAHFPSFNQRLLHHVFGFLAALQNAEGDGEQCPFACG